MPMLEVYIDFKCAGSYLALDATLALIERSGVAVQWRPYSTAERDVPDEGADTLVIASHHATREASRRAIHIKYARLRGIDLAYPAIAGSTELALGALAQIEGDPLPFIRACFCAFWEGHEALDDPQVVSELLAVSGVGHSGDLSGTRKAALVAQAEAVAAGIVDAPGYSIAGQVFVGRQHLPWIEELIRKG